MWMLALSPFVLCAIHVTLMLHVGLATGAWNTFGYGLDRSGCNTPCFRAHLGVFRAALAFTLWGAMPGWVTLVCIQRFQRALAPGRLVVQAFWFGLGWLLAILIAGYDIGRFFERLFNR